VGSYAIRLAKKASRVYAIEPNPKNFQGLLQNIGLNEMLNIKTFPVASWNKTESLHISNNLGASKIVKSRAGFETQGIRLDELIEDDIHLVKIDTEGSELTVLDGMEGLRPLHIIVEVHGDENASLVSNMLEGRGYIVKILPELGGNYLYGENKLK